MSEYLSEAYVAYYLGCRQSAVSNWIARGVLPKELKPVAWAAHKPVGKGHPLWDRSQLPAFKSWYNREKKEGSRYA